MAAKVRHVSEYAPAGDRPKTIEQILGGFNAGKPMRVLMARSVTGIGMTVTAEHLDQIW